MVNAWIVCCFYLADTVKMKKIPLLTGLIWVIICLGYSFFPKLIKQDAVQFPLTLLLSVLLPVSFWLVARQGKHRYLALLFVGIFIINTSFLFVVMRGSFSTQQQITEELNAGIRPDLAEYLVTAVSAYKRQIAARLIYQLHGVALPFKNEAGGYTLYEPDKADKGKFQKNFFARNELKIRQGDFAASFATATLLLLIHGGLFVALLVFLLLYDKGNSGESGKME